MTMPNEHPRNVLLVAGRSQPWQELAGHMLSSGIHVEWVPDSATPAEVAADLAGGRTVLVVDIEPDRARGIAIVSACRQSAPAAPVVVVAANPSVECVRRIRLAGVFYLALSPLTIDEMQAVLASAFECFDGKRPDTSTCHAPYRILIVDDDADFTTSMAALLESRGYVVSVARSGKEGLAKVSTEAPDLIVLDIMMEYDSSGYEVTETLKVAPAFECHRHIPILMVSSIPADPSTRFSMAGEMEMVTPSRYLTKPVDVARFLESVEELLGGRPHHATV